LRDGDLLLTRFPAPPVSLFTVAHAIRAAVFELFPLFFAPSSMWDAWRFCLDVYLVLLPRGIFAPFTHHRALLQLESEFLLGRRPANNISEV
jgi:hypothetical protein